MKLYDVPRGSIINAETTDDKGNKMGDQIKFYHIDGMYSYCTIVGKEKEVVNLGGAQELKLEDDGTYSFVS